MEHIENHNEGFNRNILLAVTIVSNFINPMMGAAVSVALPKIGLEFHLSAVGQAWVTSAYLLTAAAFLIPFGKAGDMLGRRKVFLWGNVIFMLSTFLCAVSINDTMLIISRLLQGLGAAMVQGTSMAIVMLAFPPNQRGKIIGYNVASVYAGLALAPVLGGVLTQALGWRSLFILNGILGIFISLAIYFKIRAEWAEPTHHAFDFKGSALLIISFSALMFGFSKLPDVTHIVLTLAGVVGIIWFIAYESRHINPVLNVEMFTQNRVFSFANITALINYAATFAITFVMSLYLQNVKGLQPRDAGMVLIAQPVMMAIVASFSGRLSDRKDPQLLASMGMSIIVIGLFLLSFLQADTHINYVVGSLLILGTGFGLFSSPNTNAAMSAVERKFYGVASASLSTMRSMGMMFSMAIASLATYVFVGEATITAENMNDYVRSVQVVFIIFTVLCFAGIFTSLAGRKNKVRVATEKVINNTK